MENVITRQQHLDWCKRRALEFLDRDDLTQAFASMTSDLHLHPETSGHPGLMLGMMQLVNGGLSTVTEMRRFIERLS